LDFDLQPHLIGPTLELRPIAPGDFDAVYLAASDPLVWEQHPDPLRWREDRFREWWRGAMEAGALVVVDRATGRIVGSTRFLAYTGEEVARSRRSAASGPARARTPPGRTRSSSS